tara:strand:- start:2412 stop:2660 length:249 start_codon:yes stop_codon:yes gene_type:complete
MQESEPSWLQSAHPVSLARRRQVLAVSIVPFPSFQLNMARQSVSNVRKTPVRTLFLEPAVSVIPVSVVGRAVNAMAIVFTVL